MLVMYTKFSWKLPPGRNAGLDQREERILHLMHISAMLSIHSANVRSAAATIKMWRHAYLVEFNPRPQWVPVSYWKTICDELHT